VLVQNSTLLLSTTGPELLTRLADEIAFMGTSP